MPRLIIGQVSDTEARIWVRGTRKLPFAFLRHRTTGASPTEMKLALEERHEFTGAFHLTGLTADTRYSFSVRYGASAATPVAKRTRLKPGDGSFQTAPPAGTERDFTFLLVSCNLHSLGLISSPDPAFERAGKLVTRNNAAFMLHVGDQIYYDVPVLGKLPDLQEYRDKYHDAWGDSKPTQAVLAQIPHYMILDDHEIANDFHNDMELNHSATRHLKEVALKAYREYQHLHNPQTFGSAPLYYTFEHAHAEFFVLDARSERFRNTPGNQMIGEEQLARLFEWLETHPGRVKFVVTCVPFVSEPRNTGDKWCDPPYRPQRDRIIDFIVEKRIQNVIFLTGDMHNSHHAKMEIRPVNGAPITVHELMSSPINHFGKAGLSDYVNPARSETGVGQNACESEIVPGTFFGDHSNIMAITVKADAVGWEIYRTRKDEPAEKFGQIALG